MGSLSFVYRCFSENIFTSIVVVGTVGVRPFVGLEIVVLLIVLHHINTVPHDASYFLRLTFMSVVV